MTIKQKLRKIDILKKTYRLSKRVYQNIIDGVRLFYYKLNNNKIIYSHYARVNNFGDRFNKDLISFFGYRLMHTPDYRKSKVVLTGSILHMYKNDFNGFVLGSGFIKESYKRLNNNWKIVAVRGPLSAKQCTNNEGLIYSDPGILASLIYPEKVEKKYMLGIVPHCVDVDLVKSLVLSEDVKIINVRQSPESVANEIKQCQNIASSSLHGLIFADAFGIPNIHLRFGDKLIGGNHKFEDYYLGMDSMHENILFKKQIDLNEIITRCRTRFSTSYITQKQERLISVYKQTLKQL